jgi:Leucine-rich repeat (LRR) protein
MDKAVGLARRRILNNAVRRRQASLDLSSKQLTVLPSEIGLPRQLGVLNVSRNQLTALPPEIGQLIALRHLYVQDNQLTALPPEIIKLVALRFLFLGNNRLTTFPPEIGHLTSLRVLDLRDNQLATLPPEIGQLSSLQSLYLGNNKLTTFPPEIIKLAALQFLYLGDNQLTTLPPEIRHLTSLQTLDLGNNQLTTLPPEIRHLTSLQTLDLGNNQLTTLPPEIRHLTSLQTLDLGNNQLTTLPLEIGHLTSLRGLDLRGNRLATLPPAFAAVAGLQILTGPDLAETLNWLRHQPDFQQPDFGDAAAAPPPLLPSQGVGPHFEVDETGIVILAPPEALDQEGNHIRRLRAIHPVLRDLSRKLAARLSIGNAPHALLSARLEAYTDLVALDLDKIDFALLYVEGIRLANAEAAATMDSELPSLDATAQEQLATILRLHGTFMLSTAEGVAAIEAEERYQRRPDEEKQYRAAAVDVARSLRNRPDIINPNAASLILGAAEQIGLGAHPERSGVAGTGALRNAVITITAAATVATLPVILLASSGALAVGAVAWVGTLLAGEGVKRSKPFGKISKAITEAIDGVADAKATADLMAGLRKHFVLVRNMEAKLRRLATRSEQFSWLVGTLDWLKSRTDERADEVSEDDSDESMPTTR